jgi:hypothetical protein
MDPIASIEAQLEDMERVLTLDPSLPPSVRAYLHLQAARRALIEAKAESRKRHPAEVYAQSDADGWATRDRGIAPSRGVGKLRRKVDPDRLKVQEQAANLIRGKTEPTRTSAIYDALPPEVRGLIKGNEPKSNLSAMLFHSPLFVSHGRAGWTLKAVAEPLPVAPLVDVATHVAQEVLNYKFTP